MKTFREGYHKTHTGCGGTVLFTENHVMWESEWDLFCLKCRKKVGEDDVKVEQVKPCENCDGEGKIDKGLGTWKWVECMVCHGDGYIPM